MAEYDNLDPQFAAALQQMIADSGGRIWIESGYRSEEEQAALYAEAVARYGEQEAGWWVAPPGKSNHNHGHAADIGGDYDWLAQNASKYGLSLPMSWEPWHVELSGTRDNPSTSPAAYTTSPEVRYRQQYGTMLPERVDPFSIVRHMLGGDPDPLFGSTLDPLFTKQPLDSFTSLPTLFSNATPFRIPDIGREYPEKSEIPALPTRPLPDTALGGSDIDRFMYAIRSIESGHNYSIYNHSGSGASGAYQFMPGTWNYYGGYYNAADAPPEVQDQKARELMLSYFAQYQNWSDVAAAWVSGPAGNWAAREVQEYVGKVIGAM